jgi:DNA invertase Pin-like site-specific DNA recombinase
VRPRAYSYLRLSSPEQMKGHGAARQLEASRAYAATHNLDLAENDVLSDLGISAYKGANIREGALGRFLDAVRSKKVAPGSTLIVESLDRISRQEIKKALALFLELINSGITIVTLSDNRVYAPDKTELVDLISSLVILSRANEESRTKSLRIASAWTSKRKRADQVPMTSLCPAWLQLSRDGTKYEVIEERVQVVRRIFDDTAAGMGRFSVARRLNQEGIKPFLGRSRGWNHSYVGRILSNPAVIGSFQPHRIVDGRRVPDGELITGYFPRVIDDATFYRVQGIIEGHRRNHVTGRRGRNVTNIFTGLARCAYCDSPMRYEGTGFLVCYAQRHGLGCANKRWKYVHFETTFLSYVKEVDLAFVIRDDGEDRKRAMIEASISALRGEATTIEKQMDATYELLGMAGSAASYVAEKLRQLQDRRSTIESELREREGELARTGSDRGLDDVRVLVDRVRNARDEDAYRLRSSIAARLRSTIDVVRVATIGDVPRTRKVIDFLSGQDGVDALLEDFKRRLNDERTTRRYFTVVFRNGGMRVVYPDPDDPTKFTEQLTSSAEEGFMRVHPLGAEQVFAPRPTLEEMNEALKSMQPMGTPDD